MAVDLSLLAKLLFTSFSSWLDAAFNFKFFSFILSTFHHSACSNNNRKDIVAKLSYVQVQDMGGLSETATEKNGWANKREKVSLMCVSVCLYNVYEKHLLLLVVHHFWNASHQNEGMRKIKIKEQEKKMAKLLKPKTILMKIFSSLSRV